MPRPMSRAAAPEKSERKGRPVHPASRMAMARQAGSGAAQSSTRGPGTEACVPTADCWPTPCSWRDQVSWHPGSCRAWAGGLPSGASLAAGLGTGQGPQEGTAPSLPPASEVSPNYMWPCKASPSGYSHLARPPPPRHKAAATGSPCPPLGRVLRLQRGLSTAASGPSPVSNPGGLGYLTAKGVPGNGLPRRLSTAVSTGSP